MWSHGTQGSFLSHAVFSQYNHSVRLVTSVKSEQDSELMDKVQQDGCNTMSHYHQKPLNLLLFMLFHFTFSMNLVRISLTPLSN